MSSTILVMGVGPLPGQESRRQYAPGLRVWAFAQNLARRGHAVVCATANFGGIDGDAAEAEPVEVEQGRVMFHRLPFDVPEIVNQLRGLHKAHDFSCGVSSTDLMNRALAQAHLTIPVWLDFFGHPMVERQMQAEVYDNDGGIEDQWQQVLPALLFGDRFSVCSMPQKHALIGELGTVGRLNRLTAGMDFIHSIPHMHYEPEFDEGESETLKKLRGPDDFVLLWTGGYNTWSDVDTLFNGLELAMARYPQLMYVSTGGEIKGHDERTFQRFKEKVDASTNRERYRFAGWVDNAEMGAFYRRANAAIMIDRPTYEAALGTRCRVQEWIAAGMPVIATALSESTAHFAANDIIVPFEPCNAQALADAVGLVIEDPAKAQDRAKRAKDWLAREYDADRLLEPMYHWCEDPQGTPDLPPPAERAHVRWPGPANDLAHSFRKYLKKHNLL